MRTLHRKVYQPEGSQSDSTRRTDQWFRAQSAKWLTPLLEDGVPISGALICCCAWSLEDMSPVYADLRVYTQSKSKQQRAAAEFDPAAIDWAEDLDYIVRHTPDLNPVVRATLLRLCRKKTITEPSEDLLQADFLLQQFFGLDDKDRALCQFVFTLQHYRPVEHLFEDELAVHGFAGQHLMALALGMSLPECRTRVRNLTRLGLLEEGEYLRLNSELHELWRGMTVKQAEQHFCKTPTGDCLPLGSFSLPEGTVAHLSELLRTRSTMPVHILLYGAPGTGKSTFARSLVKALRLKAWSVPAEDRSGGRRSSLMACLNLSAQHRRGIVLVDEAERMLESDAYGGLFSFGHSVQDKAWLNELLEEPGRRVIWITNATEQIDPSVLRRFTFSVSFEELGRRERRNIWARVLQRHKVASQVGDKMLDHLAAQFSVPPAVMDMSTRQAVAVSRRDTEGFMPALERALRSYETLRQYGKSVLRQSKISSYTLDGVNTDADVPALLRKLRRAEGMMRTGGTHEGACTLLFSGAPGTGKTALARYIAHELDRECSVVRASDLLDKYVGGTEGNIARVFRKAEREQAVLVIDEVDTFAFSRDMAEHSWENSMVNEFLTAVEQFRGILVCTTNRKASLDKASLRRFTFKVAFRTLTQEQAEAVYRNTLTALSSREILPVEISQLHCLSGLTPGDFRTVRAAFAFHEPEEVTHKMLLNALRKELADREESCKVGF